MIQNEIHQPGADVARTVRAELHLSTRIPKQNDVPQHCVLDLHCFTEEQAWNAIMNLAQSGIKTANIITGASGILKIKFIQAKIVSSTACQGFVDFGVAVDVVKKVD